MPLWSPWRPWLKSTHSVSHGLKPTVGQWVYDCIGQDRSWRYLKIFEESVIKALQGFQGMVEIWLVIPLSHLAATNAPLIPLQISNVLGSKKFQRMRDAFVHQTMLWEKDGCHVSGKRKFQDTFEALTTREPQQKAGTSVAGPSGVSAQLTPQSRIRDKRNTVKLKSLPFFCLALTLATYK